MTIDTRTMAGVSRLLDQQDVWIDQQHRTHQLTDMTRDYKAAVYAFMLRRAETLAERYELSLGFFDAQGATEDRAHIEDPVRWMASTPLMRRLAADIYNLPAVARAT